MGFVSSFWTPQTTGNPKFKVYLAVLSYVKFIIRQMMAFQIITELSTEINLKIYLEMEQI